MILKQAVENHSNQNDVTEQLESFETPVRESKKDAGDIDFDDFGITPPKIIGSTAFKNNMILCSTI